MHRYRTHSSIFTSAYIVACKIQHTIPAFTIVFLKMNPRIRNRRRLKIKNYNINLESCTVCWFVLYNYIKMCRVKTLNWLK